MAMGRPETGTAGAAVAEVAVATWVAAELAATSPKLGKFAPAAFTVLVAVCAFEALSPEAPALVRAVTRLTVAAASALPCGALNAALSVCGVPPEPVAPEELGELAAALPAAAAVELSAGAEDLTSEGLTSEDLAFPLASVPVV